MLKAMFIAAGIVKTEEEFKEVMDITTVDIKANRTNLGKKTNLLDLIYVADLSAKTLSKCPNA